MSCLDFEKLIALDVEGDLPERKAAKLGQHLKACRNCQAFAERLQASQALVKSLAQEPADEAMLEEVRQRVLRGIAAESEPHRFQAWRFALGAVLVATVIFAAVTLWRPRGPLHVARASRPQSRERLAPTAPRRGQDALATAGEAAALRPVRETSKQAPTQAVRPAPTAPEYSRTGTDRASLVFRSRKQPRGSLTASVKPPQPAQLTVKLVTDDPNVVIYWLLD